MDDNRRRLLRGDDRFSGDYGLKKALPSPDLRARGEGEMRVLNCVFLRQVIAVTVIRRRKSGERKKRGGVFYRQLF